MAEATDRPTSVTPSLPPPPPEFAAEEPYRALSLLALIGLALALLYAFLVVLGGLAPLFRSYPRLMLVLLLMAPLVGAQVALLRKRRGAALAVYAGLGLAVLASVLGVGGLLAYSGSNPWLMLEGWGWGLLGAALFLCWLGRTRVAASEGTLTGAGLAHLGLAVGLFFGLVYGAYWLASSFAISGQARATGDEYMALLTERDERERSRAALLAFFRTLPLRSRPSSDAEENLREVAEVQYNTSTDSRGVQPGPYSRFQQQQYVRLLALPGASYRFKRVARTEFDRGGYKVELDYEVEAPTGLYEVSIGTIGQDTVDATGSSRRQWHIDIGRCGIRQTLSQTEEQLALERAFDAARGLVHEWSLKVKLRQVLAAYLDTLPPQSRRALVGDAVLQDAAMMGCAGLSLAGGLGATPAGQKFREGLQKYRDGALVDASRLWTARKPIKDEVVKEVIRVLAGGSGLSAELTPSESTIPTFKPQGDRAEFSFPVRIMTYILGEPRGRYVIDADLTVEGPLQAVPKAVSPFRVVRLQLVRGQAAPDPTKVQPQPSTPR